MSKLRISSPCIYGILIQTSFLRESPYPKTAKSKATVYFINRFVVIILPGTILDHVELRLLKTFLYFRVSISASCMVLLRQKGGYNLSVLTETYFA